MKSRLRKKYAMCQCAHDKSYDDMVTDEPYPEFICWFQCAHQPHFTNRTYENIEDETHEYMYGICENCPSFTVSRKAMRQSREEKKIQKKYFKKHYGDNYLPFYEQDPSEELPF